ncbi:putative leucine-rich repeat-containing protein DDB_G0290503 [Pieris napi]|uniref:putative leucine-rich repeat-containing protein DDB_G0290503 n=1 Tax=Pieris napi TaxID=78633 RepID=UPI001FBA5A44|nr:putative leucine-rich repeat-containing protein DDB_G0290503 [Pieris napi]
MGNIISGSSSNTATSYKCDIGDRTMESKSALSESNKDFLEEQFHDTVSEDEERAKVKEEEMNEFKKELSLKREQRREILAKHKSDKLRLENALEEERKSKLELYEQNRHLRDILLRNDIEIPENLPNYNEYSMFKDTLDQLTQDMENQRANNIKLRCDLASSHTALQAAFSEMADLSAQNTESLKQIKALKEVVAVSKTLISLREDQLTELKNKLTEIEQSLADREASMLSTDLRQEYERQLQNIRTLRGLYEERARLAEVTRQALVRELDDQKSLYQAENTRCTQLNSEVEELKEKVSKLEEEIDVKNYEISACKEELEVTKSEMLVVNKLFSQVILGYKSKKDLDQLVTRLEENHGILIHMAEQEKGSEISSALPKLLLELVNQVDDNNESETNQLISQVNEKGEEVQEPNKAEEIVQNLPKVWKVLIELLSHQTESTTNEAEKFTTCYKSVETKSGPVLVPSVSQTYIRLKDLIIEKLSLIKEVNRMKQLNTHLETRLQEQEKRLCLVTTELSKTWHVVGRLRKHHHQLHTHEKILKYELQQKRKLLNELKEELEYCREKWEQAREKNTQTEQDWKKLRAEFSSRKLKDSTTFSHSAESGYSDERPSEESSESNDESEYIPESKLKSRKNKKSFEAAVDSSADLNLAEREDPVSDMIDVADLSLDTQDESHEIYDDSCNSEVLKSDRICDETEDEAIDICNDSFHEEFSTAESSSELLDTDGIIKDEDKTSKDFEEVFTSQGHSTQTQTSVDTNQAHIDEVTQLEEEPENKYKDILKSIKQQDQRLHLKDERLDELETNCTAVVTNITNTLNEGQVITEKLDALHEKYGNKSPIIAQDNNEGTEAGASTSKPDVDFKSILEDIKKQDEYLAKKDERLLNLETGCSEVVANIQTVVDNSDELLKQINTVHKHYNTEDKVEEPNENKILTEASTSNDHEARFAARDLRLKRLEEQTKSLVNKVNDTTTKGVKIHYKLEELHNIYGSEHSRSGTPSEETGETQSNDDEKESENN